MKTFISLFCVFFLLLLASGFVSSQDVELIFSHKYHAEQVEAECLACHAAAESSTLAKDNLLPDMETCYTCHDEDTECTVCHKDPDNAVAYPRITAYISTFPHQKHIEKEIACTTCHAGVEKSDDIFAKHLPDMALCQNCHGELDKPDYCLDCHSKAEDLRPSDHRLNWTQDHGLASHLEGQDCRACHTEDQCLDCHQKDNLDRTVHSFNFVNNHALQAKGNKENCNTCHEELSFCADCHRQELVMPRSHSTAGWSNLQNGGRHARAAEMDLDSCLSCHNDTQGEPICAQCHQEKHEE